MEEPNNVPAEKVQEEVTVMALVPIELHRRLKYWCFDNKKTVKDFIIEAIQKLPEVR